MERYHEGAFKKIITGDKMKIGIIFDMDGTLWDSCEPVCESWNHVLENYPQIHTRITTELIKRMMGKHMRDIIIEMIPEVKKSENSTVDNELVGKLVKDCCEYEIDYLNAGHPGVMYDGAVETLKALKEKYFVGIVSNCQDGYIESMINAYGLDDIIDDYRCAGIAGVPKAENITNVINTNQIDRAFYVGDTTGDCISAKEAGATFIYAAYGFGDVKGEMSVQDITEIPSLIEKYTRTFV